MLVCKPEVWLAIRGRCFTKTTATHPQSLAALSDGAVYGGQQSDISLDIDVSADFTTDAAPLAIGNIVTEMAITRAKMVRPKLIGRLDGER